MHMRLFVLYYFIMNIMSRRAQSKEIILGLVLSAVIQAKELGNQQWCILLSSGPHVLSSQGSLNRIIFSVHDICVFTAKEMRHS
jgi:hypothetical protein